MSKKDSFLELLGLDDSDPNVSGLSVKDESSEDFEAEIANEASFLGEESSNTDEVTPDFDVEAVDESTELADSEAIDGNSSTRTEFLSLSEKVVTPEDLYGSSGVPAGNSLINARTNGSPRDESDENSQTGIFTEEDRLLEGLEEAEYSRATDIFNPKTKSTPEEEVARRTQAILGVLDELSIEKTDNVTDDIVAEESVPQSTKSLMYEEVEADSSDGEPTAKDLGFSEDTPTEQESEEAWSAEADEEVPAEAVVSDELQEEDASSYSPNSGFKTVVGEAEEASRQTVAFDYQQDSAQYGRLCLLDGAANLEELVFQEFPVRLGRDPENDLVIEDVNSSRFHCEFQDRGGEVWVQDLQSTNGIKVNGALVSEARVQSHDVLQIGEVFFEYLEAGDQPQGQGGSAALTSVGALNSSPKKKRKRLMLVASVVIFAGLVYAASEFSQFSFQGASNQVVARVLVEEAQNVGAQLEAEAGIDIRELSADQVKTYVLDRMGENPVLARFVDNAAQIRPEFFSLFLVDPQLLEAFIQTNQDTSVLLAGLDLHLGESLEQQEERWAYRLLEMRRHLSPNDPQNEALEKKLNSQFQFVQTPEMEAGEAGSLSDSEKQLFLRFMSEYEEAYTRLMSEQQFGTAASQADIVVERILELIEFDAIFADFVDSYLTKWRDRSVEASRQFEELKEERERYQGMLVAGRAQLREARDYMDEGKAFQAGKSIQRFLKNYPEHPDRPLAKDYESQIENVIQQTFRAMKREVESYIQTENFALAWEKLYFFMDQVPNFEPAKEVHKNLVAVTANRSRQLYNQGRVFEFEADDLISAEQYYRRAMETADPRGQLGATAKRRYNEVLRKKIQ